MNLDEIKELVRLMVDNDLAELDITSGESKIRLKRGGSEPVVLSPALGSAPVPINGVAVAPAAPAPAAVAAPAAEKLLEIRSPMVGTFYAAASPDSDPFVAVGAAVGDDTAVCIIEAMKVMNEIKAELSGTVVEICVKNAQPVEYGQVLFRVRPS
jgi:acetyl-CoA carboxylase biotin carboxyl carrier protein